MPLLQYPAPVEPVFNEKGLNKVGHTLNWRPDMIGEIVLAAVFVIVLIVCLRVLSEAGFEGMPGAILAFCVAALSAMGVAMLAPRPVGRGAAQPANDFDLDFILLPYATLGLSLLALLLLLLLLRLWGVVSKLRGRIAKDSRPEYRCEQTGVNPKPDARPHRIREERGRQYGAKKEQHGKMEGHQERSERMGPRGIDGARSGPVQSLGGESGISGVAFRSRNDRLAADRGVPPKHIRRVSSSLRHCRARKNSQGDLR